MKRKKKWEVQLLLLLLLWSVFRWWWWWRWWWVYGGSLEMQKLAWDDFCFHNELCDQTVIPSWAWRGKVDYLWREKIWNLGMQERKSRRRWPKGCWLRLSIFWLFWSHTSLKIWALLYRFPPKNSTTDCSCGNIIWWGLCRVGVLPGMIDTGRVWTMSLWSPNIGPGINTWV